MCVCLSVCDSTSAVYIIYTIYTVFVVSKLLSTPPPPHPHTPHPNPHPQPPHPHPHPTRTHTPPTPHTPTHPTPHPPHTHPTPPHTPPHTSPPTPTRRTHSVHSSLIVWRGHRQMPQKTLTWLHAQPGLNMCALCAFYLVYATPSNDSEIRRCVYCFELKGRWLMLFKYCRSPLLQKMKVIQWGKTDGNYNEKGVGMWPISIAIWDGTFMLDVFRYWIN